MKVAEINKIGCWDLIWTEKLKSELNSNTITENVGEQLILENDKFKVWSIHLSAGKSLPFHTHSKPYFYTVKGKGKSRSFFADGTIIETEYKKDDIKYFNDLDDSNHFTHNLENIGNTTLIFTIVEFKK